jgi:hypothetical protein
MLANAQDNAGQYQTATAQERLRGQVARQRATQERAQSRQDFLQKLALQQQRQRADARTAAADRSAEMAQEQADMRLERDKMAQDRELEEARLEEARAKREQYTKMKKQAQRLRHQREKAAQKRADKREEIQSAIERRSKELDRLNKMEIQLRDQLLEAQQYGQEDQVRELRDRLQSVIEAGKAMSQMQDQEVQGILKEQFLKEMRRQRRRFPTKQAMEQAFEEWVNE